MNTRLFYSWFIRALLFAIAGPATGQHLAPPSVDLSYRLHAGEKLHFRRLDEVRTPDKPGGYQNGNYDVREDFIVTVERVAPNGDATMVIQTDQTMDFKGDDQGGQYQNGKVTVVLGGNTPLVRTTIDRFGRFLSGEILRHDAEDSDIIEKMKNPGFNGHRAPDSSRIKWILEYMFPYRPQHADVRDGVKWHDSTCELKHSIHFSSEGPSATPAVQPPQPPPSYDTRVFDYSIVDGATEHQNSEYRLITKQTHTQSMMGRVFPWLLDEDQHIRTSDGLISKKIVIAHSIVDGKLESRTSKQTVELIAP